MKNLIKQIMLFNSPWIAKQTISPVSKSHAYPLLNPDEYARSLVFLHLYMYVYIEKTELVVLLISKEIC